MSVLASVARSPSLCITLRYFHSRIIFLLQIELVFIDNKRRESHSSNQMIVPVAGEVDIISTTSVAQMTSHVAPSGWRVMRTSTPLIILRLASKQFRTDITLIWSKCAAHHNQSSGKKQKQNQLYFSSYPTMRLRILFSISRSKLTVGRLSSVLVETHPMFLS